MRKLIGTLLLLAAMTAAIFAWQTHWTLVIPKVLTYPATTVTFSSNPVLARFSTRAARGIQVKFDNPAWAASVSSAVWVTKAGGTKFQFTCDASSTSCMQATKGSGTYAYALSPSTLEAPNANGRYSRTWDVTPPGDLALDTVIGVPEVDPATGMAALAFLAGAIFVIRGARKK
jgi:hypothetical protein